MCVFGLGGGGGRCVSVCGARAHVFTYCITSPPPPHTHTDPPPLLPCLMVGGGGGGLNACTENIKAWMTENQLKLNDDKTEALLFPFTSSLKPTVPLPFSITLGSHNILFPDSARNLGFILDSKLSMKKHVIKICQTTYFKLKHISSIRRFFTEDATKTLVTSYILSRLDYCNYLFMGTPNSGIQPLQKIQNFAARLVLLAPRHHHSTPLLEKLHWFSHFRTY